MGPRNLGYVRSVNVRKLGVEEELLLIDPESRRLRAVSAQAVAAHAGPVEVGQELFLQQIETSTRPQRHAEEVLADLRLGRRAVGVAAAAAGARAIATGTYPLPSEGEDFTPQRRYKRIQAGFGEIARQTMLCAMHVHVDVDDDEEGVRIVDSIRPWLPVLLAISANSPLWAGRETGHASWRTQILNRWPTAGPTQGFTDAKTYRWVADKMIAWGGALDPGMLYFDARLSARYPTVEVRIADICTDLEDALLVALLARALVSTCATTDSDVAPWRADLLRVANWRAARFGLAADLVHPETEELASPRVVIEALLHCTRPMLEAADDFERVTDLTQRILARGGGATRQRRVLEATGSLAAVVDDLARRTEESWL